MHNDVSFLISNEMNLYEQQSSYNSNMPVRLLQYTGNLYEKYFKQNSLNKYGSKLISLPVPKLIVFYNGRKEQPDEVILKLSDSFPENAVADIEVKVRIRAVKEQGKAVCSTPPFGSSCACRKNEVRMLRS